VLIKEISTKNHRIQIFSFGKKELNTLEKIPKENFNQEAIQFLKDKFPFLSYFCILNQVHGDIFLEAKEGLISAEADAIFSDQTNVGLVIKTADCMPIFLYSETEGIIANIHSGWKGTKLEITKKLIHFLSEKGWDKTKFKLFLGPCIRQSNYEVSKDLYLEFKNYPQSLVKKSEEKYLLGIDIVLKNQLAEIGIQSEDCDICTKQSDDFYSHRAGDMGRNLNLIFMEKKK
jgi:hypothetical protein